MNFQTHVPRFFFVLSLMTFVAGAVWAQTPASDLLPKHKKWQDISSSHDSVTEGKSHLDQAIIYLVDKSRSMAHCNNLDAVKSALPAAIEVLKPTDTVAIIAFDNTPFVILKPGTVAQNSTVARARIKNLFPTGATKLLPTLDLISPIFQGLPRHRHRLMILTDSKIAEPGTEICARINAMKALNVEIHLIAVGCQGDSAMMSQLRFCGVATHPALPSEVSTLLKRISSPQ